MERTAAQQGNAAAEPAGAGSQLIADTLGCPVELIDLALVTEVCMNWEAVSAIGQVVGAVAVVISLVYLAAQIRDNTRSTRSATRQSIVDSIVSVNLAMAQSDAIARALRSNLDGRPLAPHEALQQLAHCYACMRTWENVHFQYRSGMLSDEDWSGFRQNVKALMQVPAFRDFWEREREVFSQAFRREVTAVLREIPASPVLERSLLFEKKRAP